MVTLQLNQLSVPPGQALNVPEIWRYDDGKLHSSVLRDRTYVKSVISPALLTIAFVEGVTPSVVASATAGTSPAFRAFCQWVRQQSGR